VPIYQGGLLAQAFEDSIVYTIYCVEAVYNLLLERLSVSSDLLLRIGMLNLTSSKRVDVLKL